MRRIALCVVLLLAPAAARAAQGAAPARDVPPEAYVLFSEAVRLELQEKFAEAIARLQKALALDPESASILYELGFSHYRLGKNKEAVELLKRSLALHPASGPAHETLAFTYAALGERTKALEELEAAARAPEHPRNHESLVRRIAWIYERQADTKNAIQWYDYLIDCGYRDEKTYLSLGTLQLKDRRYNEALASFREVVRRTPADEPAPNEIADAYAHLSQKERDDALKAGEAAMAKAPDPSALEALALAYQAAGRRDDMVRALERAAALSSARAGAQRLYLAEFFEDAGDLPRAIEWRRKILGDQKAPAADDYVRLAALYLKNEEPLKAADAYRKALAADPKRTDLAPRIANCYSLLYQWKEAAAVLEEHFKGKDLGPADAEDLFDLGEAYQQAGNRTLADPRKTQAYALLTGAIGKGAGKMTDVQIHLTLAQLCYADDKPDRALGYLLVAQQLDPDDPRKLLLLAHGYKRVQNWAEAAATYRKYLDKDSKSISAAGAQLEIAACQEAQGQFAQAIVTREEAKARLLDIAQATTNEAAKAGIYGQLGELELQRNNPKAAIERLLEAVRIDPKQPIYHLYLAQAYQLLVDRPHAAAHLKSYLDAHEPDPSNARVLYRLGVAQCRAGQGDLGKENKRRAILLLTSALDAMEKDHRGTPAHKAEILRDLAGFYAGENDYPRAGDAIQRAIQLAAPNKRADYQLVFASLLDDQRRYGESEKILLEVHKAEPENPAVLNHLGYFYAERGRDLDQAVQLVQKALRYEPLNGAYIDSLGWAYYKQGKAREAIELLLRAVVYEEDAVIRDHLGDAYHKLGQVAEARQAWTRALALDPEIKGVAEKLKSTEPKPPPQPPPPPAPKEKADPQKGQPAPQKEAVKP